MAFATPHPGSSSAKPRRAPLPGICGEQNCGSFRKAPILGKCQYYSYSYYYCYYYYEYDGYDDYDDYDDYGDYGDYDDDDHDHDGDDDDDDDDERRMETMNMANIETESGCNQELRRHP